MIHGRQRRLLQDCRYRLARVSVPPDLPDVLLPQSVAAISRLDRTFPHKGRHGVADPAGGFLNDPKLDVGAAPAFGARRAHTTRDVDCCCHPPGSSRLSGVRLTVLRSGEWCASRGHDSFCDRGKLMRPGRITSTPRGLVTSWIVVVLAFAAIIALASLCGNVAPLR